MEHNIKYLVQWRVHEDKRHETLKAFAAMSTADEEKDLCGVKLIGRWHDVIGFTGVAIAETDDPMALSRWLLHWNGALDMESTPVLDDEETRAIGREIDG
jgi:hypothetical protein